MSSQGTACDEYRASNNPSGPNSQHDLIAQIAPDHGSGAETEKDHTRYDRDQIRLLQSQQPREQPDQKTHDQGQTRGGENGTV